MTCNVPSCLEIPSLFVILLYYSKGRVILVQELKKRGGFASAFVYKQRQKTVQKCSIALRMSFKTINTNHLLWQSYKIVELTD